MKKEKKSFKAKLFWGFHNRKRTLTAIRKRRKAFITFKVLRSFMF